MVILMTPVINAFVINFPNSGHELVTENEDGSYTILINAKLSEEAQRAAYDHAMKHIMDNDFEKSDVQEIEIVAHGLKEEKPTEKKNELPEWAKKRLKRLRKEREKVRQELAEYEEMLDKLGNYASDEQKLERQHLGGLE